MPKPQPKPAPVIAMVANEHYVTRNLRFEADRYLRRNFPHVRFVWQRTKELELTVLNQSPPDLVLGHIFDHNILHHLQSWNCPVINTSGLLAKLPVPSVIPDNRAIGELAARHLQAKGCQSFAYIGSMKPHFGHLRCSAFHQTLRGTAGLEPLILDKFDAENTVDQLSTLPGYVGVLVDVDVIAVNLYDTLRMIESPLLDRIAVISSHGMDTPCVPELSSVRISMERWARQAVDLGLAVLRGETVEARPHLFPPSGIDERESTAHRHVEDPEVEKALAFIRRSFKKPITVDEVVEECGLSRRPLERRFRALLDRSILQEIHLQRIRNACLLLRETDLNLYTVAIESGFSDEEQLRRLFHKYLNTAPGGYRDHPDIPVPH